MGELRRLQNQRGKKMSTTDGYVSIEEAASFLGISIPTLRQWLKKEILPAHKIGKLWKFKISELDAWVKSGKSNISQIMK